jgi:hypothetical protein
LAPFSLSPATIADKVELHGFCPVHLCFELIFGTGQYPTDGTVLMPLGNRGNQSAPPFIVINPDASLKGVVVWHVEQVSHNLRK